MHKAWYKELEEDDDNGFAQFGGYMEAKKAKLIKQVREQVPTDRQSTIFKGISIYVNGFTKPSAEELKVLMGLHSGTYHVYQMPSTTHIIASNLPNVKINKLGPLPIVKPNWIEDSITLGRLLDYTKYLLYTNQNRTQPKINFDSMNTTNNTTTKTASDPSFLSEFYGNSRLHLIATLGAEFKQFINDIRAKSDKQHVFSGIAQLKSLGRSENKEKQEISEENEFAHSDLEVSEVKEVIMHIDMDCFFVSVGIRNRPELKGKPVAVTHSKTGQGRGNIDRTAEITMYKQRLPDGATFRLEDIDNNCSLSEIASCSYEARKQGVKNGMFMGQALKLCPELKAIPYDFNDYKEVSYCLYKTISEYTHNIEAVSCDEMYVNITNILQTTKVTVDQFAEHIRSVIKSRTGCPCSTGFGGNRLQARLATKRAKPDGQYHLLPSQVIGYFYDLPLEELPGVGRATLGKLKSLGLELCGDVQMFSLNTLKKELGGKLGEQVYEQVSGIDRKPLQYEHERKSVSAEVNYGIRFKSKEESHEFLLRLVGEVTGRLKELGMRAKCITLKLMVRAENAPVETAKFMGHGVCDSVSKSFSLSQATDDYNVFSKECKNLLDKLAIPFDELRGVGIQLSKLEHLQKINTLMKNFLSDTNKSCKSKQTNVGDSKLSSSLSSNNDNLLKIKSIKGKKRADLTSKSKMNELSNFFKSTQKFKQESTKSKHKLVDNELQVIKNIDLDVLNELPDDIRDEIMAEYNLQMKSVETCNEKPQIPSTSGCSGVNHKEKDNVCNLDLVVNTEKVAKKIIKKKHSFEGFESLSHENFMEMLMNWFQSHSKPLKVDVDMLGQYFKVMATQRNIEKLFVYVKYLFRNINDCNDCDWHNAYFKIVGKMQDGMKLTYNTILRVPMQFNCDNVH